MTTSAVELPHLSSLDHLESEAIFVLREIASEFERPVFLFSGGKDSIVVSHLARKAFWPGPIPFPFLHIDTGHNFPETLEYRDHWMQTIGGNLIVREVEESIRQGRVHEEKGPGSSRNSLQSVTLLDALKEFRFDAAVGGARRDEEKARAKERFFSFRDSIGQWDPKNQRPELWALYNGRKNAGEHFRIFPISNWTEMDVWLYIQREKLPIPSLYFSHERPVVKRGDMLLAHSDCVGLKPDESPETHRVRFRTIGDMTCTGAVISEASTIDEIVFEVADSRFSERGTRADDQRSSAAMEDRKREGYF
jgi:sulfate adenylyltransferase subunit 2